MTDPLDNLFQAAGVIERLSKHKAVTGLKACPLVREGDEFYWVAGSCKDYGFTFGFERWSCNYWWKNFA